MDKYKTEIKNLFSKLKTKKVLYIKKGINPTHDWNIFLTLFLSVLFVALMFSLYLYDQISSGKLFSQPEDTSKNKLVKINQVLLDKIIEEINNKQSQVENGLKDIPKDPSI